ncbi:hypothetical protein [Winogradskyella sp. PG-2]|uniref:hypothetical protein n=1 Tax=Winogradskyella sp. PG-2 TaxID=754409 RepID=UPI0005EE602A|nr:hypothetical protein [Winogradskyella sp. PG-2]
MSTTLKTSRIAEILSLIVFSILTILAISKQQISVFYIIYLLWIDEFLKTIFDFLKSRFKSNTITDLSTYRKLVRSRFFMLGIYVIFIIVFFGFLLDWKSTDVINGNFEVFLFKNVWFNFSVLSFFIREVIEYHYESIPQPNAHHVLSKGIITSHLSIVFGVFIWSFISGKIVETDFDFSSYGSALAIIPFLIIKFIFEIMEINNRHRQNI